MKKTIFWTFGFLFVLSGWTNAQTGPPPPAPIVESDLRDNTIKMRSIELERVKRDAAKMRPRGTTKEQEIRFAETKKNFESIQKLQDSIIKAYTTGKNVDYSRIRGSASDIRMKSLWLDRNLFGSKTEETDEEIETEKMGRESVRDLIIELDKAIGSFVKSPIFRNGRVVNSKVSKAAQLDLRRIMRLSFMLSKAAGSMK